MENGLRSIAFQTDVVERFPDLAQMRVSPPRMLDAFVGALWIDRGPEVVREFLAPLFVERLRWSARKKAGERLLDRCWRGR